MCRKREAGTLLMSNPKRNPRILWTIVLLFCLLFAVTYGERLATKAYLEATLVRQRAAIAQAKQRHQALQQQLAYVQSDAYIEETARNELGMMLPGDELLVIVESPPRTLAANEGVESMTVSPPFWQEWLQQLGF